MSTNALLGRMPAFFVDREEDCYVSGMVEPYTFAHRFTFTDPGGQPTAALAIQTHTFRMGSDFVWTALNVMGNNPTAPTADPAEEFFFSVFTGREGRPHQSEPVLGSTIRGGGRDGTPALLSFGLPLPITPTLVRKDEPIRVEVDNRRLATISIDVVLIGERRYDR